MATDRLRVEGNERLDLQDFQFILGEQQVATHRQLLSQLICSPDRERKWILSGFAITNPTGTQVQVTKGRGLFAEYRSGAVYYGLLATDGDAAKIVDINTYASGVYGIYVRFEEVEGNFQPRIFWNASGLGSEYTETIATRYLANWSVRVEATSPGDEWLQIGTVNRGDMALVDMRDFYFEGPVDGSYASGWSTDGGGIANDRSADRKTYGVADFQKFSAATRQCLEDIKGRGLRRWWERDIGGMNLGFDANPVEDRLALGDADFFLDGGATKRWQFAADDHLTYDRTGNVLTLAIGAAIHNWDATSFSPETTDAIDLGKVGKRYSKLHLGGDARFTRAAAGAGERNWQLSIADVGGFETLQLGSQSEAWDSFAAALSITRAADAGTITKITLPNGLYYDVVNYALCANTTNGTLGKSGERWKTLYVDVLDFNSVNTVTVNTKVVPDNNDGADLGESGKYFLNGYVTNLYLGNGVVNTSLKPLGTTQGLGDATQYWASIYGTALYGMSLSARDGSGPITLNHALVPPSAAGANLGSTTLPFGTVYCTALDNDLVGNRIAVGCDFGPDGGNRKLGEVASPWYQAAASTIYTGEIRPVTSGISIYTDLWSGSGQALANESAPFSKVCAGYAYLKSTIPRVDFEDTDAVSGEKRWSLSALNGDMELQIQTDAGASSLFVRYTRDGTTPYLELHNGTWFQPRSDNTSRLGDAGQWWLYCFVDRGYMIRTDVDCGGTTSGWSCFTAVLTTPSDTNDFHVHGGAASNTGNKYWMKFYCNTEVLAIPVWEWSQI